MIRHVEIKNFKSHKDTKLDFSNLTVLCGTNSSGKSSVIQALLLLREASCNNSNFEYANLRSNLAKLGTVKDVLYQFADEDKITFAIDTDKQKLLFISSIRIGTESTKRILPILPITGLNATIIKEESLFDSNFQFISAARIGPRESYSKNDTVDIDNQISSEDGKAENVVEFLDKNRYKDVTPEMCLLDFDNDLLSQVTAWEREISAGVNVVVKDNGNLGYELKYQFNTNTGLGKTDEISALNVGFGLTYALPVIAAILSAPKDAILFIENPEAHLHPRGQAKLAELICLAAQAGIQIVIETHSDHIFNGVRKSINKRVIGKDIVKVYYFDLSNKNVSVNTEIKFADNGRILNYTEGLFDQFDNDLDELLGL
jgi:predicted ATPase